MQRKLPREIGDLVASVAELERAVAGRYKLLPADLQALKLLLQWKSMHPYELAAELGYTTGGISSLLDRLQRLGYIVRQRGGSDRRKVLIHPTELAQERAYLIWTIVGRAWEAELVKLSDRDLQRLQRLLQQFHRATQKAIHLSVGQ